MRSLLFVLGLVTCLPMAIASKKDKLFEIEQAKVFGEGIS